MDRLILFRHGKAEHQSASGEDFDRGLTPRGERESRAMADILAEMGFTPDVALVSAAARARATWQAAAPVFPDAQVSVEEELYHAPSGVVRELAERAGRTARTVMVVGHNPGLQELAVELLIEGASGQALISRAANQFPTAAAAVFLIDAAGRPAYDGLFFPPRDRG
ncbi:histidine phosphatase family protein [Phenylobacterium sp.]|uniref:SixA phosphatase family protein n=1 Tax=Phenylobacterium sp. TaxID=1871053 RepID=UPI0035AEFF1F